MTRSLLLVTPDIEDNSIGRTYAIWLLARHLGWNVKVVSYKGSKFWGPLKNTDFENDVQKVELRFRRSRVKHLALQAVDFDLTIAIKPLGASYGLCVSARKRNHFSLLLDIDDPDLEARLSLNPLWRAFLWRIKHFRLWTQTMKLKSRDSEALLVSNPTLQQRYGGVLVPHARTDPGYGAEHVSTAPTIAFVGTVRHHKGVDILRSAVEKLSDRGYRLVITETPPADAQPWEDWTGNSSLSEGLRLVANSDIIVLPSRQSKNAIGQLPAKLVDAMLAGRAVVVSNVEPMPWAVGPDGLVFEAEDTNTLVEILDRLSDPDFRSVCGHHMRQQALQSFEINAVAKNFAIACDNLLQSENKQDEK